MKEKRMRPGDETVVHDNVLRILERVRSEGWRAALAKLEFEEPVLAGFALASSYTLEQKLHGLQLPRRVLIVIEMEMMTAQLVCIESMREASRALWQDFLPDAEAGT
jgi:hypothetical protein